MEPPTPMSTAGRPHAAARAACAARYARPPARAENGATVPLAARLGALTLSQLYAVAFLTGSLTLVYGLAAAAYLPLLVDRRQLVAANSAIVLSDTGPSVVGPGLAGVLVQLLTAPVAVAADAVSFVIAAALLLGARRGEPSPVPSGREAGSLRKGLTSFLERPGLWAPTAALGSHGLFYGGILALIVLYAVRELRLTPALLGLIFAVATLGPTISAIAAPWIVRRFGDGWPQVVAAAAVRGEPTHSARRRPVVVDHPAARHR